MIVSLMKVNYNEDNIEERGRCLKTFFIEDIYLTVQILHRLFFYVILD